MKMTQELYDQLKALRHAYIGEDGREVNNPRPVDVPVQLQRPQSLKEQIQRLLRQELSQQAAVQGHETFEEANDFDVPDEDGDPITPYEANMMVEEFVSENPEYVMEEPGDPVAEQDTEGPSASTPTKSPEEPEE